MSTVETYVGVSVAVTHVVVAWVVTVHSAAHSSISSMALNRVLTAGVLIFVVVNVIVVKKSVFAAIRHITVLKDVIGIIDVGVNVVVVRVVAMVTEK